MWWHVLNMSHHWLFNSQYLADLEPGPILWYIFLQPPESWRFSATSHGEILVLSKRKTIKRNKIKKQQPRTQGVLVCNGWPLMQCSTIRSVVCRYIDVASMFLPATITTEYSRKQADTPIVTSVTLWFPWYRNPALKTLSAWYGSLLVSPLCYVM